MKKIKPIFDYDDNDDIKNDPDRCKIPKNIDELSNEQRMKALIADVKTHRRLNSPDVCSLAFIENVVNDWRTFGFSKEEIDYAIKRVYSKRVRAHEIKDQLGIGG